MRCSHRHAGKTQIYREKIVTYYFLIAKDERDFKFLFYMNECLSSCMCIWCLQRPEEAVGSPGTGITGSRELPDMGTRN